MTNFWKKDQTRQEIITKTPIPNNGNFNLFANYYNLIDVKGIGLQLSNNSELEVEKLYQKNGFQYIVLVQKNQKELFVLPNNKMEDFAQRISLKIDFCKNEKELLQLVFNEMN